MSATEQKPTEKLVLIELTAVLGNERTAAVRFNIPQETSEKEANAIVDKYLGVVNRQQAKSALIGHRENIETKERTLRHMREDIEAIDEREARSADAAGAGGRKYKTNQNEKEVRIALVKNLERLQEDIDAMKKYEKKLETESE